jgi:oxalate decarboxylase/phosphoglucose isomerase-like protein (cupin superfamily)
MLKVLVAKADKVAIESLPPYYKFKKLQGNGTISHKILIEADELIAALEKLPPGSTLGWSYILPEAYYILEGRCELSYSSPPFKKWETVTCQKGDVVYLPTGIRVNHKVISEEPLVLISFHFPPGSVLNSIKLKKALGIS